MKEAALECYSELKVISGRILEKRKISEDDEP